MHLKSSISKLNKQNGICNYSMKQPLEASKFQNSFIEDSMQKTNEKLKIKGI